MILYIYSTYYADVDNLDMSNEIDFRDIREIQMANQQDPPLLINGMILN